MTHPMKPAPSPPSGVDWRAFLIGIIALTLGAGTLAAVAVAAWQMVGGHAR